MRYTADRIMRGSFPVYGIYDGMARFAETYSEARAMFLVTALNSLTDEQARKAHAAGAEKRVKQKENAHV